MTSIIGLLWDLLLLGIAAYTYAYSRGFIRSKNPEQQKKIDEFRDSNKWLIYVSLFLGAISIFNLYLRFFGE